MRTRQHLIGGSASKTQSAQRDMRGALRSSTRARRGAAYPGRSAVSSFGFDGRCFTPPPSVMLAAT